MQANKNDPLFDNSYFYDNTYLFLRIMSFISRIFIFFFIVGVLYIDFTEKWKNIFSKITYFVKFFVAILLVYRFNSYRMYKIKFTELDRKIAYSAGLFIILISVYDLIIQYSNEIHKVAYPYTSKWVQTVRDAVFIR